MNPTTVIRVEDLENACGPFIVSAETTIIPILFTDAAHEDNPVVFVNDSFLDLTGYSRADVIGSRISRFLHPSDTDCSIRSALQNGSHGTWQIQCRRFDGTDVPASVFHSPVRDPAGKLCQNFLFVVPLGAYFDRLTRERNEFRSLFEQAPGFIATTDGPEHRFTFTNAAYQKFVGRNGLEGRTVAEALPDLVDQGFIDVLDRVYATGTSFQGTAVPFDMQSPSNDRTGRFYADFVYQPVRDTDGNITGLFCEGYDSTAQHVSAKNLAELQAELIHLSRVNAMGTMAVTLAHELNRPLSAIANYTAGGLRLIDKDGGDSETIAQALFAIQEASQRASDIIATLRELSKRREPSRGSFNLKSAIAECVGLVRAAALPNVTFVNQISRDVTISADRIQVQQVVINLLRNACDAVGNSKRTDITISTLCRDNERIVSIADTGPGVSVEAAQDIFSWTDSTKEGGMGLGLSICRTIIEAHRGRIWLGESSNSGSTFCFSLPLEPVTGSAPASE